MGTAIVILPLQGNRSSSKGRAPELLFLVALLVGIKEKGYEGRCRSDSKISVSQLKSLRSGFWTRSILGRWRGTPMNAPDVLHRPPSRPGTVEVVTVAAYGVFGRAKLKQIFNCEFIFAE